MDGLAVLSVAGVLAFFFLLMLPFVLLANKLIGKHWERDAERIKRELSDSSLGYSEDGARIRVTAIAPFAFSVRWLYADIRVDRRALWLMQYHRLFGVRIGQPCLRVTWAREPAVGGYTAAPMVGHPTMDGSAVVVSIELRLSSVTIRIRARDPGALLDALHRMH